MINHLTAVSILCASLAGCRAAPAQSPAPQAADNRAAPAAAGDAPRGYYREPSLQGDLIVFCAEGDLWRVPVAGGTATRITTALGEEDSPAFSPDGSLLAFCAEYEGPTEVYVMPTAGGLPRRLTWDDRSAATVAGWRGDKVLASTDRFSTLPSWQLTLIDASSAKRELLPLAQASDGCYSDDGKTLFFTRLQFQGSHSKRYKGGTAQNLWRFAEGDAEAVPLTADYTGTSASPMWWSGRLYFTSDRGTEGTMEIWSMLPDGKDLRQHTRHQTLDVKNPSLQGGRIVFQRGADIHLYDIAGNSERLIDITLSSDFDQTREKWITKPQAWISAAHISPDGQRVAITARGRVFVAPRGQGRLVDVTPQSGVRHREARFLPDGKTLVTLSDQNADDDAPDRAAEVELWTLPANGIGEAARLTSDGDSLRWEAIPSPDGKWIAHHDKNLRLWLYNTQTKVNAQIDETNSDNIFEGLAWSPDSRWLAYVFTAQNLNRQVKIHNVESGASAIVTTDRYDSSSPAWSPDGQWLYLLSERHLDSTVNSPWGRLQPEPYFDHKTKIYQIALKSGTRSPFAPEDELHPESKDKKKDDAKDGDKKDESASQPDSQPATSPASAPAKGPAASAAPVEIDLDDIQQRIQEVPVPPGNYSSLIVTTKRMLWLQRSSEAGVRPSLMAADVARKDVKPAVVAKDVNDFELSLDGKSILLRREGGGLLVIDADAKPGASLDDAAVNLNGWTFALTPREEWRQMFIEAWRLERDYFYDRGMVGVDWKLMLQRYLPLVDRVATRTELSDLISQMVGELSTLHTFVRGGDTRNAESVAQPASMGGLLVRDEEAGGFRVQHVYQHDPDRPELAPPLARPDVNVKEGETITLINGQPTLSVPDVSVLLRNQAGRQVLMSVKATDGTSREVIVVPFSAGDEANLRYHEWEFTRRSIVEKDSNSEIGYLHLRAMGGDDFSDFAREFYPVFKRKGLIIDVRHNRGGNIDSWIISRLLRKAWFYWQPRIGTADWNMHYAFRGHIVVLCNERTASDGEAFTEGVKRLKVGHTIGTRTWGGEVWLSSSNILVDRGIATAAETGVYGPEGVWLIEGHGVEPDQVVDNTPHKTFMGEDAQLQAAIEYLRQKIKDEPVDMPPAPPYPNLRWPK